MQHGPGPQQQQQQRTVLNGIRESDDGANGATKPMSPTTVFEAMMAKSRLEFNKFPNNSMSALKISDKISNNNNLKSKKLSPTFEGDVILPTISNYSTPIIGSPDHAIMAVPPQPESNVLNLPPLLLTSTTNKTLFMDIKRKYGYLFEGYDCFLHVSESRYPIAGILLLEDGQKGLHLVWLATDQSGMSKIIPLDAVTQLYEGRTSPTMTTREWISGDHELFFSVFADDVGIDIECSAQNTSQLWVAGLSCLTKIKPISYETIKARNRKLITPVPAPASLYIDVSHHSEANLQQQLNPPPSPQHQQQSAAAQFIHQQQHHHGNNPPRSSTSVMSSKIKWEIQKSHEDKSDVSIREGGSTSHDNGLNDAAMIENAMIHVTKSLTETFKELAHEQGQAFAESVRDASNAYRRKKRHGGDDKNNPSGKKLTKYDKVMKFLMPIMATREWLITTTLATIWSIFGIDIYLASGGPIHGDPVIYAISFIVFLLFMYEISIFFLGRKEYRTSFYLLLDLIAAISLIPDFLLLFNFQALPSGQVTLAKAGRAARAGTKAARLVRIVKLINLISIQKQHKLGSAADKEVSIKVPSRIGTRISDLINQKVIVIVALMLMMSAFSDLISTPFMPDCTWDLVRLETLANLASTQNGTGLIANKNLTQYVINDFKSFWQDNLLTLYVAGLSPTPIFDLGTAGFRDSELFTISTDAGSFVTLNLSSNYRMSSVTNICQVVFVIIVLMWASVLFNNDSQRLIIKPLESMSDFVNRIVQNPLMNVRDLNDEVSKGHFVANAIKKFLRLLQIALGDAGAAIMSANLGSTGQMTAVVPGRKVRMVFGFCDIRSFTDCTECLQEDVMVFVNTIAKIVHFACKENEGSPNKNIGDAFLLAWSLPEKHRKVQTDEQIEEMKKRLKAMTPAAAASFLEVEEERRRRSRLPIADHALKTFVQVINEAAHSHKLQELTQNAALQQRLPGYRTQMGFGLHLGWAIEGAIGSELKIDASYLSPNVNMAARLEAATKQFGVKILMTENFWMALTSHTRQLCRRLDRVTVKGSNQPISLYTYDVVARDPEETGSSLGIKQNVRVFFDQNGPLHSAIFRNKFNRAVELYVDGHWDESVKLLKECYEEHSDDKPTNNLLTFMGSMNNQPPAGWEGYRELTEK